MVSASAPPILLVMCTGNVCRSPMAEALFVHHLTKRQLQATVISRGLAAPIGRLPHSHAIEVAQRKGVPIDPDKRAAMVTSADVAMADIIFVMETEQRREIQRRFPMASGKIFLLGQWRGQEIVDPINQPLSVFEHVWDLCAAGVEEWVSRLTEAGILRPAL